MAEVIVNPSLISYFCDSQKARVCVTQRCIHQQYCQRVSHRFREEEDADKFSQDQGQEVKGGRCTTAAARHGGLVFSQGWADTS